ncbi:MAG: gamma carbonic anhydrase family protein [Deltaproteobacteria bacterium]|jgi:carbonic anhydrase/acetyltransferase-like protein (isoleucine patch superfamily)|nr:gamma carbonic anhydrase family protein [Deltaproteobacteria bacterium]
MVKLITPFFDKTPGIHPSAFVDRSARIIGDVTLEEGVSVWPMAVLRADSAAIFIGRKATILDLSLVEAPTGHPVIIDEEALISHRVVIHGAQVQKRALIGIGAIVLDGAVISSGSIIGAGSVVAPGTTIPANSLVMGTPGKVIRETTEEERALVLKQIDELYTKSRQYKLKEG